MSALASIFREQLIPWISNDLEQRLVVAQPVMKNADVPYGDFQWNIKIGQAKYFHTTIPIAVK